MEKRLRLAQKLLKNTGVIFISIDDNEQAQLKLLRDEILGENNFIANIPRRTKSARKTTETVALNHDYVAKIGKKLNLALSLLMTVLTSILDVALGQRTC